LENITKFIWGKKYKRGRDKGGKCKKKNSKKKNGEKKKVTKGKRNCKELRQ
jgi:hypothetical protein